MEDSEYVRLRNRMVETQLVSRGIRDKHVLEAMRRVPRHLFVEPDKRYMAYDDMALLICQGQTISQPYMVAVMTQLLDLTGAERVLEIGSGSGYQTAVLAELSREVFTVEMFQELSGRAKERLGYLGYANVFFTVGDGTVGWPDEAPFDRVLVTAGAPRIPEPLAEQLGEGGIIVVPVGSLYSQQLIKARKIGGRLFTERHTPCVFVPLVGKFGWSSQDF